MNELHSCISQWTASECVHAGIYGNISQPKKLFAIDISRVRPYALTASSLAHRADVRGSHSPLMSLLRALAHALRPSLLQRRAVSTAPSLRGLEEFFEKPPAEGEKVVVGEHRPRAL